LRKIRINKNVANKYCSKVALELNFKIYKAAVLKIQQEDMNSEMNFLKGVLYLNMSLTLIIKADPITVFEGFFDFLSYQWF
jgi:hypothetical protein